MFLIVILVIIIILINKKNFKSNFNEQKIHIVSFAHNCCEKNMKRLEDSVNKIGLKLIKLNLDTLEAPDDIKEYIKNNKRGAGYWIWKPYVIKQIINKSNPGDIIIYSDASRYFKDQINNIIEFINKNSIFCFKHGKIDVDTSQYIWTKMNAVSYYGYNKEWCENEGKKDQFTAAFVGVLNNTTGNKLINLWLNAMTSKNSKLFDDSNIDDNCGGFKESRHDQQILSLILYKFFPIIDFPDYNNESYNWVWQDRNTFGSHG